MGVFTYLRENDFIEPTGNKALDDGLLDLRTATGDDWRISAHPVVLGPWWRRKKATWYSLYCGVGTPEFQTINFYRDGSDWSINLTVPAELIVAYMFGTHVRRSSEKQA